MVVLSGFVTCAAAAAADWVRRERPWPGAIDGAVPRALAFDGKGRLWISLTGGPAGREGPLAQAGSPLAAKNLTVVTLSQRMALVHAAQADGTLAKPPEDETLAAGSVLMLEDSDGDGTFDRTTARGGRFDDETDAAPGGLASDGAGGALVLCPPRLWRIDGTSGRRTAVVPDGLGVRLPAPDTPAACVARGPDACVWFTVPDTGFNVAVDGPRRAFGPRQGGVFRCRTDGTGLECVARGLRAPSGLAFDADGTLLVADGAALRVVTPGLDGGWDAAMAGDPEKVARWLAAPLPSAAPPTARLASPVRALLSDAGAWPEPWRGCFVALTETGLECFRLHEESTAWRLEPLGQTATFSGGVAATLTPTGSVLVLRHEEGRASLLEWSPPGTTPEPPPPAEKLATLSADQLVDMLGDALSRQAAQDELLTRPWAVAAPRLARAAVSAGPWPRRRAAIRTLGALSAGNPLLAAPVRPLLGAPEPEVRREAALALGRAGDFSAVPALVGALGDATPRVRTAAATALATLHEAEATAGLLAAAESATTAEERLLFASALAACAPPLRLAAARGEGSSARRLAAVLALRRLESDHLAAFLDDTPDVALEAARAIWHGAVEAAWPALAARLKADNAPGAEMTELALAANLHLGGEAQAARVVAWAAHAETPSASRVAALRALETWDTPPLVDPFLGLPISPLPRPAAEAWGAVLAQSTALGAVCTDEARATFDRLRAAAAAVPATSAELIAALADEATPPGRRLHFFREATRRGADVAAAAEATLASPHAALRSATREWLWRKKQALAVPWLLQSLQNSSPAEKQEALRWIDDAKTADATRYLVVLLRQAAISQVDPAVIPELEAAIDRRVRFEGPETRSIRGEWELYLASRRLGASIDTLLPWRPALQPGDATGGRRLYFSSLLRCASCHALDGRGGSAGPDLTEVGARLDDRALLEAVVRPSATVASSSLRRVDFADGTRVTAPAVETAGSLQIGTPAGGVALPRAGATSVSAPLSPCRPVGRLLTAVELRDLVTFLRTLRPPVETP